MVCEGTAIDEDWARIMTFISVPTDTYLGIVTDWLERGRQGQTIALVACRPTSTCCAARRLSRSQVLGPGLFHCGHFVVGLALANGTITFDQNWRQLPI